jgi:hypothetical protein
MTENQSKLSDVINVMKEMIQTDDAQKSIPLNVISKTGPQQVTLCFPKVREYSENDDSEFVKKIKSFGILDETDITFKGGYIFGKDGGFALDMNNFQRDFEYKSAYINKRDKITKESLKNDYYIDFVVLPNDKTMDDYNNYDSDELFDDNIYFITYEKFMQNNMKIDGLNLQNPDEIVLESSYCNVLYSYPGFDDKTAFTIKADDEITGFTRKELALKVMQRYHLLCYLFQNYDKESGCVVSQELAQQREERKIMFRSVMYETEWTDNGLKSLIYHKETNQWTFECCNYI